jgi:hypothetical protein
MPTLTSGLKIYESQSGKTVENEKFSLLLNRSAYGFSEF